MPIAAFSIITPSYNSLSYLKRCVRSVQDQEVDEKVEHMVIDGGSTDGTTEWLQQGSGPTAWISEPDRGMYDAINKGLDRARGEYIAYLNCDEQYLPGTLARVKQLFDERADVDLLFGDALLVRPDGSYAASRHGYPPRWFFIGVSQLYVLSCTMFFRKRILEKGFRFDPRWKAVGDVDFVMNILRAGYRAYHDPMFFSAFTMTGENLGGSTMAIQEMLTYRRLMPFWVRVMAIPLNVMRLASKWLHGGYRSDRGTTYSVYAGENSDTRTTFTIHKSNHYWPTS